MLKSPQGCQKVFEVDGLVVKVSSKLGRNWLAPKAQTSGEFWGHAPSENFNIYEML